MNKKIFALFFIFAFILTSGFGCKKTDLEAERLMKEKVILNYWRVFEGQDAFNEIIEKFNELHPYITIKYKKLRYSEYEDELLDALAEDRGPDMFSIHNTWIRKYENKIEPLPESTSIVYLTTQGTIKKETVPEIKEEKSITLKQLKDNFVDVVYDDVVVDVFADERGRSTEKKIFGLPLSVDTLAMYYNKDLFNNAGIPSPSSFWNREFQQSVKNLTKQNTKGQLQQIGVALGGSDNIERYSDILSILMMQNGAQMINDNGTVVFHQIPDYLKNERYNPGIEALRFYSDFANPAKEVYCWNNTLDNSIDLFAEGKLAMMFGYSYHLPIIKARAPKLNFEVAKLPQIEGSAQEINFANYWVETVSKKSEHIEEAWNFLQFVASPEQVKSFLNKTKKPTALRSLIQEQLDDLDIGVFANQVLSSQSWYKGNGPLATEEIIGEMIDSMVAGEGDVEDIITFAARRVQETID